MFFHPLAHTPHTCILTQISSVLSGSCDVHPLARLSLFVDRTHAKGSSQHFCVNTQAPRYECIIKLIRQQKHTHTHGVSSYLLRWQWRRPECYPVERWQPCRCICRCQQNPRLLAWWWRRAWRASGRTAVAHIQARWRCQTWGYTLPESPIQWAASSPMSFASGWGSCLPAPCSWGWRSFPTRHSP